MVPPTTLGHATITLLTDFGTFDVYVGVMKGVLHALAPDARVIDLTHEVSPQDVLQGAFLLEQAHRYFPAGTVHLVVVDPGVGTSRRRLAIAAGGYVYVGPDNGVLSAALPDLVRGQRGAGEGYLAREVRLPTAVTAVAIEPSRLGATAVSATFEGRDVFSPAAARLARGESIETLGTRVETMMAYSAFRAPAVGEALEGVILHTDRYGNFISDIRGEDMTDGAVIEVAGRRLSIVRTYAESTGLCALVGSSGFVEVALPGGSAAAAMRVRAGEVIRGVVSG